MGPIILRPGQRILAPGVRVIQPSMATLTQWFLAGGISAANCIAAYQPKGAVDLASSYINLANPGTNNAAPGVAPTWDATNGWTFNGTSQYLATGITPSSNWSVLVRFSSAGVDGALFGCQTGGATSYFQIFPRGSSGASRVYRNGNVTGLAISGGAASGVVAVAGATAYYNGAPETGTLSNNLSGATTIFIGARNSTGTANGFFGGNIQAISIYNISIASYISALTTAINAL